VFNKRYKKLRKLGEGAQGTVFSVEDLQENNKK
jgi:serine/threonine protein kinase